MKISDCIHLMTYQPHFKENYSVFMSYLRFCCYNFLYMPLFQFALIMKLRYYVDVSTLTPRVLNDAKGYQLFIEKGGKYGS